MDIISISDVHFDKEAKDCDKGWKSNKGIGFEVNIMEGSEWFTVMMFFRGIKLWASHNFTKTEYAKDFMKCHKMVCEMLKICQKHGILDRVSDEADYWNTMDDNILTENKKISSAFINVMTEMLAESGTDVVRGDGMVFKGAKEEKEEDE